MTASSAIGVWDVLPWDHNAFYDSLVLRELPDRCERVLEVGCGAGRLTAALSQRVAVVEAVDRSPEMVAEARVAAPRARVRLGDVLTEPLASYDAVVSMSVLHHLPLEAALTRFAGALRPGGRLVAVGIPARDLPREVPVELVATTVHHALGVALLAQRRLGRTPWWGSAAAGMPVAPPVDTLREVRRRASSVLPGVRVRRLVLWRYLLTWDAPG